MKNDFLFSLKKDCIQRNIPVISDSTEKFLSDVFKRLQPKNCLEIGSAVGYSLLFTANFIKTREGNTIGFEISYPSYKESLENLRQSKLFNAKIFNLDFLNVPLDKLFNEHEPLDFVFVDGRKKDYLQYLLKLRPFLTSGTEIIFDDVVMFYNKMQDLYEFLDKNKLDYKVSKLENTDGVLHLKF